MNDHERAVVMAYTGVVMLTGDKLDIFHKYIEDICGRPIWTHELAIPKVWEEIKEKSKNDFIELCHNEDSSYNDGYRDGRLDACKYEAKAKPQGDIISREALKEQIKEDFCKRRCPMPKGETYCNPNCAGRLFMNIINNAPTVAPVEWQIEFLKKLYEKVRPPGKWEEPFEMNGKSYHKCTNCHISSELILIDKYCPNCGAPMKSCDEMRQKEI